MASVRDTKIFNNTDRFIEGWYWALASRELKRKQVKAVRLLGRDLVVYRGEDGVATAMDAYCPHMGAHLAEGRVDGNSLRCFFHDWKYARTGECVEVPCLDKPPRARVRTFPTEEKHGLIWVWTGDEAKNQLPFAPELRDLECDAILGNRFIKKCHPNVMLINAIDEQHFNSVHHLPTILYMETESLNRNVQLFANTNPVPDRNILGRALGKLYAGPLTYALSYHYGGTGTVTLGPDAFHFYIMFALRMIEGGHAEGQTVLLTRKRPGLVGKVFNRLVLEATEIVGNYFAKGDTQVFQTMKFDFRTPTRADHAIIDFIQHIEGQQAVEWGSWEPSDLEAPAKHHLEVVHA